MKRNGTIPRPAIPTDSQGRVDFARLLDQVVPGKFRAVESLVLGALGDFDELFAEVKAAPELARLRWGESDDTILHWAAAYGAVKLVRLLVRLGADVNASAAGERPLHWAARQDVPIEICRLLLKHGADVDAVSPRGQTPLHEAVVEWNLPIVKLLLRHKADTSIKDRWGYTAVDWAAIKWYHDVVVELLKKGARIEHREARASLAAAQAQGWLTAGSTEKVRLTPKAMTALQRPTCRPNSPPVTQAAFGLARVHGPPAAGAEELWRSRMEARGMRLTPAQIGMHALLGHLLPMGMPRDQSLTDRIRDGHSFLVRIARVDLGYDPGAWHKHLRATNAGGYRWSNKHLGMPRQIALALANPEWQQAVAILRAELDADPAAKVDERTADGR
jgi:hypothetical protein